MCIPRRSTSENYRLLDEQLVAIHHIYYVLLNGLMYGFAFFFAEAERFLSISLYMTNVRVLCNFFLNLKIYILTSCSFLIVCPIYKCIVSYRYNHLSLFSRYESIPHVHDDTSKLLSFSIVTFSIILSDVHIRYVKWVLLFHQRTVFATIDIMPLIQ